MSRYPEDDSEIYKTLIVISILSIGALIIL
jgi:hypothetical protein